MLFRVQTQSDDAERRALSNLVGRVLIEVSPRGPSSSL